MKLTWFLHKDTEEPKYQVKITGHSFFGSKPKYLDRINAYKIRTGRPIILQEQTYITMAVYIGQYMLNLELQLKPQILAEK